MNTLQSLPDRPLSFAEAMSVHEDDPRFTPLSRDANDDVYTFAYLGESQLHGVAFDREEGWVVVDSVPEEGDYADRPEFERELLLAEMAEALAAWMADAYPEMQHDRI